MDWAPDTEGIFLDLPESVYRSAPGIPWSSLKWMEQSPAKYLWELTHKKPSTPAQIVGTVTHALTLQPHLAANEFVVRPSGMTFTTKEGKSWRDAQTAPIISEEDYEVVMGASSAVRNHPIAGPIIGASSVEVAVFKRHPATGLLMKGRLDMLYSNADGLTIVGDLKTTDDARATAFHRDIEKYRYWGQLAYYVDLAGASSALIVAAEKPAPHGVVVHEISAHDIARGRELYDRLLTNLAECLETDQWPGYPEKVETFDSSTWRR